MKKLLSLPYFKKAPPKSRVAMIFLSRLLKSKTRVRGADLVATATAITVESIAQAYEKNILKQGHPLSAIYCAGGGAKNEFMMELLARRLAPVQVKRLTEAGIAGPFRADSGAAGLRDVRLPFADGSTYRRRLDRGSRFRLTWMDHARKKLGRARSNFQR